MAKCIKCGRSGIFLKLRDGLCNDCIANIRAQEEMQDVHVIGLAVAYTHAIK